MRKGILFAAACLILFFSGPCMAAAMDAARVFVTSVLPALFPMMILSSLSEALPQGQAPMWREALETSLFCFLSGSPASAKRLSNLLRRDDRFSSLTDTMMGLCGVISPLFFLGTMQSRLPPGQGAVLLFCHWISAMLTGFLLFPRQKRASRAVASPHPSGADRPSLPALLPGAIGQSMQSLLAVLGAMMLSSIAATLVKALLCCIFPSNWQKPEFFAVLWAILEIGGGGLAVLDCVPSLPLLCGLCSFGGLSIWMQCLMFIGKEIRPGKLIMIRLLHGALGYLVCWIYTGLCGGFISFESWLRSLPVLLFLLPALYRRFFGKPRTCSPHS